MGSFREVALNFTSALHALSPQECSGNSTSAGDGQRRGSGRLTECLSFSETTGAVSQVADI